MLLVAVAAAGVAGRLGLLRPSVPWSDEWTPPPGFDKALADLTAGHADDGERRMTAVFRRHRSPIWKRRANLALGMARLRRGENRLAAKALARAERAGGAAAQFARMKRAEAELGAGRPSRAEALLDAGLARLDDPVLSDDYAIALARAQAAGGFSDRAQSTLAAHLGSAEPSTRARVLEAAAMIAEQAGDSASAAATSRKIYLEEPRSREAAAALQRLTATVAVSDRFRPVDLPAIAARARALIAARDGKGALATWDTALLSLPEASSNPRWGLEIAEAAIEARQPSRALSLLGPGPASAAGARRALILGRALFAAGRDDEGISSLRAAAGGSGPEAAEALFLLATGLDQTDRDREAVRQFLEYLRRFPNGERTDDAAWRAGWLSFRAGRFQEAIDLFQSLLSRTEAEAYHPSALYWTGRAHEAARRRSLAVRNYVRLADHHARDYYGLLAGRRLESLKMAGPRPPDAPGSGASRREAPRETDLRGGASELGRPGRRFCERRPFDQAAARIRTGCELETIGLYQEAERQYVAAAALAPERSVWLRLSEMSIRKGDRSSAVARLKAGLPDYLSEPIESLPHRYWEVLYPRLEWEAIESNARKHSLDPTLVCGLILQESAFNPLAVSSAGALGLMQVLPATGQDAARAVGLADFTPARLLEPATNIRLGTWHFAQVLRRAGGRPALALASYNAGEGRVRRWIATFGASDLTRFVEEVPYVETRLYVKRVISHAAMYRAIYGP